MRSVVSVIESVRWFQAVCGRCWMGEMRLDAMQSQSGGNAIGVIGAGVACIGLRIVAVADGRFMCRNAAASEYLQRQPSSSLVRLVSLVP